MPVPSLFFIGTNGAVMEVVADDMTALNLQMKIDSVLNRVEKTKNTSNDLIKAEQDLTVANIPGPSTAVISTSQNNNSTKTVTTLSDTEASSKLQEQVNYIQLINKNHLTITIKLLLFIIFRIKLNVQEN